jgi:hypothetical protein
MVCIISSENRVAKQVGAAVRNERRVLELVGPGADKPVPVHVSGDHQRAWAGSLGYQQALVPANFGASFFKLSLQNPKKGMLGTNHAWRSDQGFEQVCK